MGAFISQFGIVAFLLALGLIAGKTIEINHNRRLKRDEEELADIKTCNLRQIPATVDVNDSFLVMGGVVVATDYFKTFAAAIRNLFGGEIKSYKSLMDRARREAQVRMLIEAREQGAKSVWNIRFETATIQGKKKNRPGGVEVLAYGTAIK